MTNMAIDSRAFGANVRSEPQFGDNVVGFLNEADPVVVTGAQQGDRWMPCDAQIGGRTRSVFISKNVLRDQVSAKREALVRECIKQWLRFEKGTGIENVSPFSGFVGEYWRSINLNLDGTDRDVPWSAAFISFCVRESGYTNFKFAAAHAKYVHQAIRRKLDDNNGPFWGFRISEHKPQLGDMVCKSRAGSGVTYNHAAQHDSYASHCDIVVAVRESHVVTIGGNVSQSVSRTNYPINDRGFLKGGKVYAVLRNNL